MENIENHQSTMMISEYLGKCKDISRYRCSSGRDNKATRISKLGMVDLGFNDRFPGGETI